MKLAKLLALPCLLLTSTLVAEVPTVDQLQYPALPDFNIPQPERFELANGMVIMLVEDHELPLIEGIAMVRTGGRHEPADKVGLAQLVGDVLRTGGSGERTGDELDQYLEGIAASIESSISDDLGRVSMSCLKDDFPQVLAALADVLRRPAFAADKLDLAKNEVNTAISRQNDNPQGILFRETNKVVYGADSPYARTETYQSIADVSRDDLVAWHQRDFHPERIILGLVGDFETAAVMEQIRAVFGDWPRGPQRTDATVPEGRGPGPGVYYIEKNDMTQSSISMGHLGIRKDDPDFYAVEVMNSVLSGSFSSRLFNNVRSTKGLAYAVTGSVTSAYDHASIFFMFMTTKTETTGEGIEALLEEARNMTAKPPTEAEVERAKTAILNSYVFQFDSPRKILNQQLIYEYYGYPLDRTERYRQAIEKVTIEQVREAAAKHIRPDEMAIIVVGPSEGRDKPLETYGEVTALDITIPEPAADKAEATEEGVAKAAALLEKAVEAMGGASAVDGVETLEAAGTLVQVTPAGEFEVGFKAIFDYPNRYRQEAILPVGKMAVVLNGDKGFSETPQGVLDLAGPQLAQMKSSLARNTLTLLQKRTADGFQAVALGADQHAGTAVEKVQIESDGTVTTLHIDPANGRIVGAAYRGNGPGGAPGEVVKTYSDFRSAGALTMPWKSVDAFDGKVSATVTMESVEVNGEVDPVLFERPAGRDG